MSVADILIPLLVPDITSSFVLGLVVPIPMLPPLKYEDALDLILVVKVFELLLKNNSPLPLSKYNPLSAVLALFLA